MNMTAIEYENSIIVMDCGLAFPSDDMLGIDLVIPDVTYLVENLHKVKGFFITHTVLPHIVSQILLGSGHRSKFAAPQRRRQSERTASKVPHPTNETGMIRNVIGRRTPSVCSSVRVKPTQKISFVIAIAPPCLSVESPYDSGRVSTFSVARRCAWG